MNKLLHPWRMILLCALLTGCGGGAGGVFSGSTTPAAQDNARLEASRQGFSLKVLDESYRFGGSASYGLSIRQESGETVVDVTTEASGLRSLYFELQYNGTSLHPVAAQAGQWPDSPELLQLALLNEAPAGNNSSSAWFGATLLRPQEQSGASGSFTAASLRFASGPAAELRSASRVPKAEASRIPDLDVSVLSGNATFSYYNQGDYNQDGRVSVTDLTPIGIRFGDAVPAGAPNAIEAVVDGSADGRINVQDLTPIGVNFMAQIDKFNLYVGSTDDYAADNNGAATLIGSIPFAPDGSNADIIRIGNPTGVRLSYSATFASLATPPGDTAWLRPVSNAGAGDEEGIASLAKTLQTGGSGDHTAPVWEMPLEPGISSVVASDSQADVTWSVATDADSPPVTYLLYYNDGLSVDFGLDPKAQFAEGTNSTTVTGLTNGTTYSFAVRASDSATPTANVDSNFHTLQGQPLATQDLPTDISEDMTFDNPIVLPDAQVTTLTNSPCLTFNHDLTIDGELEAQDENICLVVYGKLTVNGKLTLRSTQPDPAGSGTDPFTVKIEAHGDVVFSPSSELENDGNFYLVDNSGEFTDPATVVDDTDTDLNSEIYPFTVMNEDPGQAMSRGARSLGYTFNAGQSAATHGRKASDLLYTWNISGDWGKQPGPAFGVHRIIYRVVASSASITFDGWDFAGPDALNAPDVADCAASGARGDDAFRFRVHCAEELSFNNSSFDLARGGRGGSATAASCIDAYATGGNGGNPGRFRFTSFTGIDVGAGGLTISPGHGGDGGNATAIGRTANGNCPADAGSSATAEAGDGADVYFGVFARGSIAGLDQLVVNPFFGGNGGNATAVGGDGGANFCPCGGDGGDGGFAVALAGKGGDATAGTTNGVTITTANGGNGGNATGTGGNATDGGACIKDGPGGNGGAGGAGSAVGGDPGAADGTAQQLTPGVQGNADAHGGNGGNGGDGCTHGGLGAGGIGSAAGLVANEVPGTDGISGNDACAAEWFIPLSSILPTDSGPGPEPIPDGFSGDATLYNTSTLQVVGSVPFVWHVPVAAGAFWDVDLITNAKYFQMDNTSTDQNISLDFDFSQVSLDSGADPYGIFSSRLFVRENHNITDLSLGSELQILSTPDMQSLYAGLLDNVIHLPGDSAVEQNLDFGGIFDNSIYRLNCPPQWTTAIELIYITDP